MLVAPVNKLAPAVERTIEFKGLNKRAYVDDGEMSAMQNLTSDGYPVLRPRALRGKENFGRATILGTPFCIESRYEHLAMLTKDANDVVRFYFANQLIDEVTGLTANTRMVAINNKICFFPEGKYIILDRVGQVISVRTNSYASLAASIPASGTISVSVNTTDSGQTLTFPGDISMFKADDAITITGTLTPTGGTATSVTVSCAIESISGQVMTVPAETFIELTTSGTATGTLSIAANGVQRSMPSFNYYTDHVIEWNNRLWMARFEDNTIYASKLGDPTNWQYFQSTSLDSYYAEQGTDGEWTGVAAYSSHLIFFKKNSMTKIYGTAPSNYQITNTKCYGVDEGSSKSVVVINDMVLYNSPIGLMVYEGSSPYAIAEKFGDMKYSNAVAGTDGRKYYVSIKDSSDVYHLMVLDVDRAVWHEEDNTQIVDCCTHDNHLYFIKGSDIWITNGGSDEQNMEWMATFGPFDEYVENKKIYSKLSLRLNAKANSSATVYIKLDNGNWELINTFAQAKEGGVFIPIVPRRCDRYSVKIEGTGEVEFKALTRRYRVGGTL